MLGKGRLESESQFYLDASLPHHWVGFGKRRAVWETREGNSGTDGTFPKFLCGWLRPLFPCGAGPSWRLCGMAEAMPSPGSNPARSARSFAPHEPSDYAQGRLAVAPSLRERMFALALAKFLQRIPFDLFAMYRQT
jgi:hypothetical protein